VQINFKFQIEGAWRNKDGIALSVRIENYSVSD
jgi:hypothetical protein